MTTRALVLMYHGTPRGVPHSRYSLAANRFRSHLDLLQARGWKVVRLSRNHSGRQRPGVSEQQLPDWCLDNGFVIRYSQPGKPNQNANIERFNRTYRNEVLNPYLFRSLGEVREITGCWLMEYNDQRPHDALGGKPPSLYAKHMAENPYFKCFFEGRVYVTA